jgi:hypothetical protein
MPVQFTDARTRALEKQPAKDMIRLRDPETGAFLHLSGQGATTNTGESWLGFRHQAETLRQRAIARGDAWPFRPVHRDLLDVQND